VVLVRVSPQLFSHTHVGSGYKARTHLAKSLQTQCKAIRGATETYNRAAQALNPPRPPLDWAQVSRYSFLEEFGLLQNTQHDITKAPWADPVIRETIKKFFRVRRAREEIHRCNVEIRRLFTSIYDEDRQTSATLELLARQGGTIFGAVSEYSTRRKRVNSLLLGQIQHVFHLDGFTGDATRGCRKGSQLVREDGELGGHDHTDNEDPEDEDADDIESNQVNGILDFLSNL
jgi:hypothetical protein